MIRFRLSTRRTFSLLGITLLFAFFLAYTRWSRDGYSDVGALDFTSDSYRGQVVAPVPHGEANANDNVPWVVLSGAQKAADGAVKEYPPGGSAEGMEETDSARSLALNALQSTSLSDGPAPTQVSTQTFVADFLNATSLHRDGPSVLESLADPAHALPQLNASKVLVVATTQDKEPSWPNDVPGWTPRVYVVDNTSSPIHTPRNAGNEATPYLWFIIQNYDDLPDFTAFVHYHESAIHSTDSSKTTAEHLTALNLTHVTSEGWVNLRCQTNFACAAPINLADPSSKNGSSNMEAEFTVAAWSAMFPGETMPEVLQVACCGQFIATREQIRKRPRSEYVHLLQWLWDSQADAFWSGRVFEHLWQYVFRKGPVYCPNERACRCYLFGWECERMEEG